MSVIALQGAVVIRSEGTTVDWYLKCDSCSAVDSMNERRDHCPLSGVLNWTLSCPKCGHLQSVALQSS